MAGCYIKDLLKYIPSYLPISTLSLQLSTELSGPYFSRRPVILVFQELTFSYKSVSFSQFLFLLFLKVE